MPDPRGGARLNYDSLKNFKALFDEGFVQLVTPLAEQALNAIADRVIQEVQVYPPQPDRWRSGRLNTYVRGVGSYPRSAFTDDGKLISLVAGIDKVRFTSEQLSLRWGKQIASSPSGMTITLYNSASYSDYVVGEHQVWFHELTGWPTISGAMQELEPYANAQLDGFLDVVGQLIEAGPTGLTSPMRSLL